MTNIIISSLIFAIWSVLLFFNKKIGLSLFLFIAPFTYYVIYLLDKNKKIENKKAKILFIPIVLLSLTYFIFDNQILNVINIMVIPTLIVSMLILLFNEEFNVLAIIEKLIDTIILPISECSNSVGNIKIEFNKMINKKVDDEKKNNTKKLVKAVIVTLAISSIIIALLTSADSSFYNLFSGIFNLIENIFGKLKINDIIVRIILTVIVFVYIVGIFQQIIKAKKEGIVNDKELYVAEDNLTIKMILGSLNFIYLIFVIVQINEFSNFNSSKNYASFARRGFFQLMIVSIINLITILVAKKSEVLGKSNSYLKSMSLVMILFTFSLLISSAIRMNFYEQAYGYTHLRFLVYYALFTEAILLVPTILYILDKKMNLTKVYFVIVLITYLGLNFINMDRFIARRNVNRYLNTGKIDFYYLKNNTGLDAIPEVCRLIDVDDKDLNKQIRGYLKVLQTEFDEEKFDIREVNLSRLRTKKMIYDNYKEK